MKIILKSKYIIIICTVMVMLLTGIAVFATQYNKFFSIEQKVSEIGKKNDTGIVALVDDKKNNKRIF
mgnify:CR=1 FL=1